MMVRTSILVCFVLSLTGCPSEPMAIDDTEAIAVAEATRTISSSVDVIGVMDALEGASQLSVLQLAAARRQALDTARSAFIAAVNNRLCISVDTDRLNYVEVTYRDCPAGLFRLLEIDGSVRAELELETEPCSAGECPVALRYQVSTPQFRIGARFGTKFVELGGSWSLRDPLVNSEQTVWDSGYTVATDAGRRLATSSRVAWSLDETDCVRLSFDGEFTIEGRDDIALVAASARDIVRCPGACPSAGRMQIAFGRGSILSWAYTGEDEVVVAGPRGNRFSVRLPCADDEEPTSE